ncbi:hypothetical protein ACA910_006637 [Epithemia clementina (nom. ined.)]
MSTGSSDVLNYIQSENENNQVVIWSKSYCSYCRQTKQLFQSMKNVQVKIHELDKVKNGSAIQSALQQLTAQRTVPNVFVNNTHVGGNDNVQAANRSGKLGKLLRAEGDSEATTNANDNNQDSGCSAL